MVRSENETDSAKTMLSEVQRMLKPNGYFFLCAAWDVAPWLAQGDQALGVDTLLKALLLRHTKPLIFRVKPASARASYAY